MEQINNLQMQKVEGGGSGLVWGVVAGVGALIVLITGIIDGYLNPLPCNNKGKEGEAW